MAMGDCTPMSYSKNKRNSKWLPLEVTHKGQRTKVLQMLQEEQGLVECYV